jgi:DNA polymerase elongation subunit (family B)
MPNEHYILYAEKENDSCFRLAGDLHYKWAQKFTDVKEYQQAKGIARGVGIDHYVVYNPKEAFLIKSGVTYYKGMQPKDVSVLSFDIETTGLSPDTNKCLMISNTYRSGDKTERRLFEYKSEKEMIYAWCSYVCDINPSIMLGHNIFGFDLPFLKRRLGKELPIGRMQAAAKTARRVSQFRKDGSQSYDYTNVLVPGREIIDTFHLALKFDTARKYPSYGLKPIIEFEGLERADRQHYDAGRIGDVYFQLDHPNNESQDLELAARQWEKIKKYAEHDADDALALFDLMIPAYFYYCQHIPKTMQQVVNSATGSQINSFMVRAYLSKSHSIPKASEAVPYEGAISFGNPGIYKDVGKVDVASLYPSIILADKIYDRAKDPNGYFLKMVDYFTKERLENKERANTTGIRKFRDLEQAQKIVINSAYGFMGAPGLNFNSPANAAVVTRRGREILKKGIKYTEDMGHKIVNADTDSFSFETGGMNYLGFKSFNAYLNGQFGDGIIWEPDSIRKGDETPGLYKKVVIVKAKNYILQDMSGYFHIKGSALKATMKEPALKEFIGEVIDCLLEDRNDELGSIYKDYAGYCTSVDLDTITKWSSKKTVTKAVLNPKRTNEQRVWDAITSAKRQVQEGDKIFVYFKTETELALRETFDGAYSKTKLLEKLFKTAKIFETILDMDKFPNLKLKKNRGLLEELSGN